MRKILAITAALAAVSGLTLGAPVGEALEVLRGEVREELQWLEGLEPGAVETFLEKHCPATSLLITRLGEKLAKAKAGEQEEIRQEITAFVEDRVYLHREFLDYQQQKQAKKAKACLQIFLFEDQKVLAEVDLARLRRKKAKPAQVKAKQREIEELDRKIDRCYGTLDTETAEK